MKKTQVTKVNPKNDLLFKKVFASPKNSHILIGFLQDLLGLEVSDVTIENPYNIDVFRKGFNANEPYHTEVDLVARLQDQTLVTIEMQVSSQTYFLERSLLYLSEKFVSNYGRLSAMDPAVSDHQEKYSSLKPTYSINILDFNLFQEYPEAIHEYTMFDIRNQRILVTKDGKPIFNASFFELSKQIDEDTPQNIKEWFAYFNNQIVSETAPAYIHEAVEIIQYHNLEKEEKTMLDALEKAKADYDARMIFEKTTSKTEGREEGKEEGREEERIKIAKNMLAKQCDRGFIIEMSGITERELAELETR